MNIVDLGFVRAVTVEGRTAVIAMTLTSAACPLTGVMEDQIRAGLAPLGVDEVRIDWRWTPAWRPDDMTDSGREQLRADRLHRLSRRHPPDRPGEQYRVDAVLKTQCRPALGAA